MNPKKLSPNDYVIEPWQDDLTTPALFWHMSGQGRNRCQRLLKTLSEKILTEDDEWGPGISRNYSYSDLFDAARDSGYRYKRQLSRDLRRLVQHGLIAVKKRAPRSSRGRPSTFVKPRRGRPPSETYSLNPMIKPLLAGRFSGNKFWDPDLENKWRKEFFGKARYVSFHGSMAYFQGGDFSSASMAVVLGSKTFASLKNANRILLVIEPEFVRQFSREYHGLCEKLRKEEAEKSLGKAKA